MASSRGDAHARSERRALLLRRATIILGIVCVVRRAGASAVLAQAQEREGSEESKRQRLAAGELGLDIYGMCGKLEAMGLVYE